MRVIVIVRDRWAHIRESITDQAKGHNGQRTHHCQSSPTQNRHVQCIDRAESQIGDPRHSRSNCSRGVGKLGVFVADPAWVVVLKWMEDWIGRVGEGGDTAGVHDWKPVPVTGQE